VRISPKTWPAFEVVLQRCALLLHLLHHLHLLHLLQLFLAPVLLPLLLYVWLLEHVLQLLHASQPQV